MATRDRASDEAAADRYRREAEILRRQALEADECGNEGLAHVLRAEATDCSILAAGLERDVRGLPPLPPAAMPT